MPASNSSDNCLRPTRGCIPRIPARASRQNAPLTAAGHFFQCFVAVVFQFLFETSGVPQRSGYDRRGDFSSRQRLRPYELCWHGTCVSASGFIRVKKIWRFHV
jgi:hypothetical protein